MDGNGSIIRVAGVAWGEGDAPELLIVEFEGVSGLLNLPIADSRMCGDFRKEYLDFDSPQFMLGSSRELREEPLHPADAVGDGFFHGAGVSKDSDKPLGPDGRRISWSGDDGRVLRHGKASSKNVLRKG